MRDTISGEKVPAGQVASEARVGKRAKRTNQHPGTIRPAKAKGQGG